MDQDQRLGIPEPRNDTAAMARTRRGFIGALLVSIGSALVVGLLWLLSRDDPSAGRDPDLTSPAYAPTRPAPTPAPAAATP